MSVMPYAEPRCAKVPGDEHEFVPLPPDIGRPR